MQTTPKIEIEKRKRGRPSKMTTPAESDKPKGRRGRPKKDVNEPNYLHSKPMQVLPKLRTLIFPMPTKMVPIFGKTFTLNNDIPSWYCFHSKRLDTLSETTQKQYKLLVNRLKKESDDIYERIIYVMTQPLAKKAQFVKAWLNHLADKVHNIYEKPEPIESYKSYEHLLLEMFMYAEISKRAKTEVNYAQMSQVASEERINNTVEWDEWVAKADKFANIYFKKKDISVDEATEMALAALYSMLPPIRLDYDNVNVMVKTSLTGMKTIRNRINETKENTFLLGGPSTTAFYWYKFKNAGAFDKEGTLPIVQYVPNKLRLILKKYWAVVGSPTRTKLFDIPHFSEKLSNVAKIITGKNFTNRLMRSSFIQDFYTKVQGGKMDLDAIQGMMRSIHQTNIEVNLSYIKKLAEEGLGD